MPEFNMVNFDATTFLHWLVLSSATATAIAGVVLVVQTLFARWLTPAGRQQLWLLVIIRLLLPILPASALSLANVPIENLWTTRQVEVPIVAMPAVKIDSHFDAARSQAPLPPIVEARRSWAEFLPGAFCVGWASIAIALLGRLIWANRKLSVHLRRATPIDDPQVLELIQNCATIAGLRTAPAMLETNAVSTPAVFGSRRPIILMPVGLLESLSTTQKRHVVLHEMSHIRHHDVLANWLLAVLSIAHWFNPLLWLAFARLKSDREMARDAWVVRTLEKRDATSYANTLIDLAQQLSCGGTGWRNVTLEPVTPPIPQLFGRTSSLKRRLHMVTRLSNSQRGSTILSVTLLVVVGGAVLTGAQAQTATSTPPATTPAPTTRPVSRIQGRVPNPPPTIESLTKRSQSELNYKDYNGVVRDLKLLLQLDPNNTYARGLLPLVEEKIRSVPEEQIREKLTKKIPQFSFNKVGVGDVVDFLRDIVGVNIQVNWKGLESVGVTPNTPISVNMRAVQFSSALDLMLDSASAPREHVLGYVIASNGIYVTTQDELEKAVATYVYEIGDLLNGSDGQTADQRRAELVKTIKEFIDRDTWQEKGGVGTINASGNKLTIVQRPATVRHIDALLLTMRNSHALQK